MVKAIKQQKIEYMLSNMSEENEIDTLYIESPLPTEFNSDEIIDVDSLIAKIDSKIAKLNAEQNAEEKRQDE